MAFNRPTITIDRIDNGYLLDNGTANSSGVYFDSIDDLCAQLKEEVGLHEANLQVKESEDQQSVSQAN